MDDYANLVVVPLFLIAAVLCGATAFLSHRRWHEHAGSRDAKMWALFAVILLVFVGMKAEHVVGNLSNAARDDTRRVGVYDERHPYQVLVVVGAACLALGQAVYFSSYIAQRWRRYRWPLIGMGLVICFGMIRAVSLHEIDALGDWVPVSKVVVESLAAVLVAWGAVRRIGRLRMTSEPRASGGD